MTTPPGDSARERRAEQLARDGEFAPALAAADRIQDPASRDAALLAVVDAQLLAGDFVAASVTPTRIRSPWFLAEALRLISLAAARIGERSAAKAGFKLAADGTVRVPPELRHRRLGRIAVAEARAATFSDEYLEMARTTLNLVRSEVERVEPGKVLRATPPQCVIRLLVSTRKAGSIL